MILIFSIFFLDARQICFLSIFSVCVCVCGRDGPQSPPVPMAPYVLLFFLLCVTTVFGNSPTFHCLDNVHNCEFVHFFNDSYPDGSLSWGDVIVLRALDPVWCRNSPDTPYPFAVLNAYIVPGPGITVDSYYPGFEIGLDHNLPTWDCQSKSQCFWPATAESIYKGRAFVSNHWWHGDFSLPPQPMALYIRMIPTTPEFPMPTPAVLTVQTSPDVSGCIAAQDTSECQVCALNGCSSFVETCGSSFFCFNVNVCPPATSCVNDTCVSVPTPDPTPSPTPDPTPSPTPNPGPSPNPDSPSPDSFSTSPPQLLWILVMVAEAVVILACCCSLICRENRQDAHSYRAMGEVAIQ